MENINVREHRDLSDSSINKFQETLTSLEELSFEKNFSIDESSCNLANIPFSGLPKKVKKHVYAVHCSSSLGLIAKKIFNCLLCNAQEKLKENRKFSIPTRELIRAIGYNSNDYAVLRSGLDQLNTTAVHWNILGETSSKKNAEWRTSTHLAAASLSEGVCNYEFSSYMQEYLADPDVYVLLDLDVLAKFKSSYGISLYENCIRFIRIKHSDYMPLKAVRFLMGIRNDKKYPTYKSFKQFVLLPALKEVNNHAHFNVYLKEKRAGKTVVSLKFVMEIKPTAIDAIISENLQLKDIKNLLTSFGVNDKKINEILTKFPPDYISTNINFALNSRSYKSGQIQAVAGFIVDAIETNYAKKTKEVFNKLDVVEKTEKQGSMEDAYNHFVNNITEKYIVSQNDEEIINLKNDFEKYLEAEGGAAFQWYKQSGLEKVQTRTLFNEFVKKRICQEVGMIPSLEEFTELNTAGAER